MVEFDWICFISLHNIIAYKNTLQLMAVLQISDSEPRLHANFWVSEPSPESPRIISDKLCILIVSSELAIIWELDLV